MSQYAFGSGLLWGTPTVDASGAAITTPTPILFGALQDCSIDVSFETKALYGSSQFPLAVGRGKGKIVGKAKFAQISGAMLNSLFFGQTLTAGLVSAVGDTAGAVIPATPFTVTVAPPAGGVFSRDLGVVDSAGLPVTRVAAAPAAGQYMVSATGVYTFAAADTGKRVYINHEYTVTSTVARKSTVMNLPMGYSPSFQASFEVTHNGKSLYMTLPNCVGSKLGLGGKNDDFNINDFDFEGFADASGQVLTWSTAE